MASEYVKAFIIGSSYPVFIWYFNAVVHYTDKNYSFEDYAFVAPLYLGLLNVFGLFLSKQFSLERDERFFLTGLIGASIVAIIITVLNSYNKSQKEWIAQYIGLYVMYIFVFLFVVNSIDLYLS